MATETFNIPWVRAHNFDTEWKTDIDGEYTAHEQRNALWSNPRLYWKLTFEKSPETIGTVRSFFNAHRGKWKAFNWVYASTDKYGRPTGGDDQTYLVRFDNDRMSEAIKMGYSTFELTLVTVVTDE